MRRMTILLVSMLFLIFMSALASAQPTLPFDQNKDIRTGPEVGEKIPDFRAVDQNGRWVDFDELKGPQGAVLVFHRSADW